MPLLVSSKWVTEHSHSLPEVFSCALAIVISFTDSLEFPRWEGSMFFFFPEIKSFRYVTFMHYAQQGCLDLGFDF